MHIKKIDLIITVQFESKLDVEKTNNVNQKLISEAWGFCLYQESVLTAKKMSVTTISLLNVIP